MAYDVPAITTLEKAGSQPTIVAGDWSGEITFWDKDTGERLDSIDVPRSTKGLRPTITCLRFAESTQVLFAGIAVPTSASKDSREKSVFAYAGKRISPRQL